MKKILLLLIFVNINAYSQLGKNSDDFFKTRKSNYDEKEILENHTIYYYFGKIDKISGDNCNELVSYFFDNKNKKCFKIVYTSCREAINTYITNLSKIAVKESDTIWKDFSNNSIYKIKVDDKYSVVEHYFEYINENNKTFDKLNLSFITGHKDKYEFRKVCENEDLKKELINKFGITLFEKFISYIAVQSPIKIENGQAFMSACFSHSCGFNESALYVDINSNFYYAGIIDDFNLYLISNNPKFDSKNTKTYPQKFLKWTKNKIN